MHVCAKHKQLQHLLHVPENMPTKLHPSAIYLKVYMGMYVHLHATYEVPNINQVKRNAAHMMITPWPRQQWRQTANCIRQVHLWRKPAIKVILISMHDTVVESNKDTVIKKINQFNSMQWLQDLPANKSYLIIIVLFYLLWIQMQTFWYIVHITLIEYF